MNVILILLSLFSIMLLIIGGINMDMLTSEKKYAINVVNKLFDLPLNRYPMIGSCNSISFKFYENASLPVQELFITQTSNFLIQYDYYGTKFFDVPIYNNNDDLYFQNYINLKLNDEISFMEMLKLVRKKKDFIVLDFKVTDFKNITNILNIIPKILGENIHIITIDNREKLNYKISWFLDNNINIIILLRSKYDLNLLNPYSKYIEFFGNKNDNKIQCRQESFIFYTPCDESCLSKNTKNLFWSKFKTLIKQQFHTYISKKSNKMFAVVAVPSFNFDFGSAYASQSTESLLTEIAWGKIIPGGGSSTIDSGDVNFISGCLKRDGRNYKAILDSYNIGKINKEIYNYINEYNKIAQTLSVINTAFKYSYKLMIPNVFLLYDIDQSTLDIKNMLEEYAISEVNTKDTFLNESLTYNSPIEPVVKPVFIRIWTSGEQNSGTDSYIYFTINNKKYLLDNEGNDFERNTKGIYLLPDQLTKSEVEGPFSISIEPIGATYDDWKLYSIEIFWEDLSIRKLSPNYWLNRKNPTFKWPNQTAFIEIKTKNELYAGTDNDVYIKFGTKTFYLDTPGYDDFERNDTYRYRIDGVTEQELKNPFTLGVKATSGGILNAWKPEWVKIYFDNKLIRNVRINRWFDKRNSKGTY